MATNTIRFSPGVNTNQTPSLNEAAYQTTQLIRWDPGSGLPQKLGGWVKYYPNPISSNVTALHAWEDLSSILHLAVGAVDSIDVITNGVLTDITPEIYTSNNAPDFSTLAGSTYVTIIDNGSNANIFDTVIIETPVSIGGIVLSGAYAVTSVQSTAQYMIASAVPATVTATGGTLPTFSTVNGSFSVTVAILNHGLAVGDTFTVTMSTTVGGITLFGFYTVASVINPNAFTINASNAATATASIVMNSGNVNLVYYVAKIPTPLGSGFGNGGFGVGGFGQGVPPAPFSGTPITATDWTLDNFGGFLVACPDNGPIFLWNPQGGLFNAQMISEAPTANTGILVASAAQIIFAYGSSVLGVQDPLLINWCNDGDYTDWIATATNLAGSFRLSRGAHIVGAIQGPQYIVVWTDLDVWAATFIGAPDVYSFTPLAEGCGLLCKFGAGVLGSTIYWISQKQFFCLPSGGSVTPLPCTVWDFIFQNLDTTHVASIRCAPNSQFGEISWYFPTIGSGTGANAAYVKYTPSFNAWDCGYLGRSAWIDQSGLGPPIGSDSVSQYIYQHETSNDADGAPLVANFTTGFWATNDGEDYSFCDIVYPDMKFSQLGAPQGDLLLVSGSGPVLLNSGGPLQLSSASATVAISFTYAAYAQGVTYTTPTYTMQVGTPSFLNVRFRYRLASMSLGSSDLGSFWRLGGLRMRTALDGRLG